MNPAAKSPGRDSSHLQLLSVALVICLGAASSAFAHDPGLSTASVQIRPGKVEAVVTFAMRDAGRLLDSDAGPCDDPRSLRSDRSQSRLKAIVAEEFCILLDDSEPTRTGTLCRIDDQGNVSLHLGWIGGRFRKLSIRSELLARLPQGHRQYLAVQNGDSKPVAECMLSAGAECFATAIAPESLAASATAQAAPVVSFLALGIQHILTGYDHLLFLLGLLIVSNRFVSTLRLITSFTLAHSITLMLATLDLVPAPGRIIEPLIAASIVYVGIENLVRSGEPKGRWLLTFAFGLVHGCGFASALRELGVGANGTGVALPLVSFNLGVEFGQAALAGAALPLIWKLRTHPVFRRRWIPAVSCLVALAGLYWFVERVWW